MIGGMSGPDGKLGAVVTFINKTGPAGVCGIAEGDQVRRRSYVKQICSYHRPSRDHVLFTHVLVNKMNAEC